MSQILARLDRDRGLLIFLRSELKQRRNADETFEKGNIALGRRKNKLGSRPIIKSTKGTKRVPLFGLINLPETEPNIKRPSVHVSVARRLKRIRARLTGSKCYRESPFNVRELYQLLWDFIVARTMAYQNQIIVRCTKRRPGVIECYKRELAIPTIKWNTV